MLKWRKYNGALIPKHPPHVEVSIDATEVLRNINKEEAFFARWTTNFDCREETEFWYVICDEVLDIASYSKNTRNQIRRGLKKCEVRMIDKCEVKEFGFECYKAAFLRYNTHLVPNTLPQFKDELDSLDSTWEFWGIYNEGKMIGYCQNKVINDYCDYSTIKFHPEYLKLYPSYALFYTMNQYYLKEKNFKYVNDGARSISHETNIQSFLIQKFKFRKAYCKLNIVYNKPVGFLVTVIYPFRLILKSLNFWLFIKLNILINQEKIRRSYD